MPAPIPFKGSGLSHFGLFDRLISTIFDKFKFLVVCAYLHFFKLKTARYNKQALRVKINLV